MSTKNTENGHWLSYSQRQKQKVFYLCISKVSLTSYNLQCNKNTPAKEK